MARTRLAILYGGRSAEHRGVGGVGPLGHGGARPRPLRGRTGRHHPRGRLDAARAVALELTAADGTLPEVEAVGRSWPSVRPKPI